MNTFTQKQFSVVAIFVLATYFFLQGIIYAKSFFAPLLVAIILAMLVLPLANRLENWKFSRGWAAFTATLILFSISVGFFVLVTAQVNNVVDKWDQIKETMKPKVEQASTFIVERTPIKKERLETFKEEYSSLQLTGKQNDSSTVFSFVSQMVGFMGSYLLVFIYIFFMLLFRKQFKTFLLSIFANNDKEEIKDTIYDITSVAQDYLIGKSKLIGILAVIYSIGLGISGVSNFILVALLAALLTLIPYIGNVIGFCLAIIFGYLTQGDASILIGILITFTATQFIESYVLQPYVLGDAVDINPLFIIIAVIAGNLIWGVLGMIIAIPVLGILNAIFLHVSKLQPLGDLLKKE